MFKNFCWEEKERSGTVLEIKYNMGNKKKREEWFFLRRKWKALKKW